MQKTMEMKELPLRFEGIEESPYAGFWRRFGAFWLDILIMLPWTILINYIDLSTRLGVIYTLVPAYLFFFFYSIYTVKRWGGTPGKLLLKIIVVRKDGKKAGWKEAILRYAVQLLLGIPITVAYIVAMLKLTDQEFSQMDFIARTVYYTTALPDWYSAANIVNQVWVWSEFVVMLLNKRKRAIHDYIAGTVVIKKKFREMAESAEMANT